MDRILDWIDAHDDKPGSYGNALARIVARRAMGPAIGEPADMPRWLARTITAASAVVMLAMAAGAMSASIASVRTAQRTHLHAVTFHDDHFTGVMIGNSNRAIVVGHGKVNGFLFDANAKLD